MEQRSKVRKTRRDESTSKSVANSTGKNPSPYGLNSDWIWGAVLLVGVILAYSPVWWAGFIWDDDLIVTANPCIAGPYGLKEIWTTRAADVCPLTLTTFWLEYKLWGSAPLPYHLVTVLLHGASAVVLWRVSRGLRIPGAWLGAALWAFHPVMVESVAWISEMKNTESCLFFLLSIFFFVRTLRIEGTRTAVWDYLLTLLFAALAMASKSSTVILPLVLCLCAWWMESKPSRRMLVTFGLIFVMALGAGLVSIWTQKLLMAAMVDPQLERGWPERAVTAGFAVWFYLGKLLWPHPLIMIYPRWEISVAQWISYLPLFAILVVSFILWVNRNSWSRSCLFVWAYFLVALLPVVGLVNNTFIHYSFVADHFQYLASMGPLALAGAGLVWLANFFKLENQWSQSTFGGALLLVFGALSWQQAWAYQSEDTLWSRTLEENPGCWVGQNHLGLVLREKGELDQAISCYQKALELNPNYDVAEYNWGVALYRRGQLDDAFAHFQRAVEINPEFAGAHYNLGVILNHKERLDEAMAQFQKTLELDPNHSEAHNNLGSLLLQKGRPNDALAQFHEALRLKPDNVAAQANLAKAQAMLRKQADQK